MSKRLEKNIFDKLLNGKLLGKRNLSYPVKYNYENPRGRLHGRFYDMLFFPKSRFDRFVGDTFERILPGIEFFFYREEIKWTRELGYTLQEKRHGNLRHYHYRFLHGIAQMVNPFGYQETHRRDAAIRRTQTLMPGIQAPDWAQENRRSPDYDLNSFAVMEGIRDQIFKESTPYIHGNVPNFTVIHNIANQYWILGRWSQRLFFNEELRGDFYDTGYLSEGDKKIVHGWYARGQADHQRDRKAAMTEEERIEQRKQADRWSHNLRKHFPEYFKKLKFNPIYHKYDEPYYERNMANIRSSIFTLKWNEALENKVFSDDEIKSIYQFFIGKDTSVFFTQEYEGETYQATSLYSKFTKATNFPDILSLDRFNVHPPEHQFYDLMDKNWGINFDTVDSYRRLYLQMIKNNTNTDVNSFVLEEVYNPVFRQILKDELSANVSQTESLTLKALEKGHSIEEIRSLAEKANHNITLTSLKTLEDMVNSEVRKVVKTKTNLY